MACPNPPLEKVKKQDWFFERWIMVHAILFLYFLKRWIRCKQNSLGVQVTYIRQAQALSVPKAFPEMHFYGIEH